MFTNELIGQEQLRSALAMQIVSGSVPHALLFTGKAGYGGLALALGYAELLLCQNPTERGACGVCPSCRHSQGLTNIDLYFTYPILKKGDNPTSDLWGDRWRDMLLTQGCYVTLDEWIQAMTAKASKKGATGEKEEKVGQAHIYASESVELTHRMYLKSASGSYKVALIWLPERMNEQCANKILKLLEEPPERSVFLLVSEQPEKLLDTIRSRCRQVIVPPVATDDIKAAVGAKFSIDDQQLASIAHSCAGDYIEACRLLMNSEQSEQFFEWFTVLTRNAVSRNVKGIKQWGDEMAKRGVDMQKQFLLYCARMIRENFIYNLNVPDLNYMNGVEQQFAVRFAPFITEKNCEPIINEINLALRHVEQNVSKKMVFFNLALQLTAYIKK